MAEKIASSPVFASLHVAWAFARASSVSPVCSLGLISEMRPRAIEFVVNTTGARLTITGSADLSGSILSRWINRTNLEGL
jgi:hypothetical protein